MHAAGVDRAPVGPRTRTAARRPKAVARSSVRGTDSCRERDMPGSPGAARRTPRSRAAPSLPNLTGARGAHHPLLTRAEHMPTAFRTSTNFPACVGLGLALALGALGCGHAQSEVDRPQASLSTSPAAQTRFRTLRAAWFAGSTSERRRLEPE